jgi:hypothetical protein
VNVYKARQGVIMTQEKIVAFILGSVATALGLGVFLVGIFAGGAARDGESIGQYVIVGMALAVASNYVAVIHDRGKRK